jgi:hypothetical protein
MVPRTPTTWMVKPATAKILRAAARTLIASTICLVGVTLVAGLVVWMTLREWYPLPDHSQEKPAVGDPAQDFTLRDPESHEFHLSREAVKRPIVIEFGSWT